MIKTPTRRLIRALIVMLVVAAVIGSCMSVEAVTSNEETMSLTTTLSTMSADCTDNVQGWTQYGQDYTPNQNDVDYSAQYTSGDDLTIMMNCTVNHGNGLNSYRFTFDLEVFNQTNWTGQYNPCYRDSWIFDKQAGQTGQFAQTLQVTIPQADSLGPVWCVYYTCEVRNLDTQQFDIDVQNYWAVIV